MVDLPGPHPLPSPDFLSRPLPIVELERAWVRFHPLERSALYWGLQPPRSRPSRWDAPDGSFGVLYVGADEHAAFIETFGHNTGVRLIQMDDLAIRGFSRIAAKRPLRLVPVTGSQLALLGADSRLFSGDYAVAQQWSRAIHEHPDRPDGIYYPARHDEQRMCAALFDRASPVVSEETLGTLADPRHARLLAALLRTYGFGIL